MSTQNIYNGHIQITRDVDTCNIYVSEITHNILYITMKCIIHYNDLLLIYHIRIFIHLFFIIVTFKNIIMFNTEQVSLFSDIFRLKRLFQSLFLQINYIFFMFLNQNNCILTSTKQINRKWRHDVKWQWRKLAPKLHAYTNSLL